MPEDPICNVQQPNGDFILCLDPPPMALVFEVSDTLFGPRQSRRLTTFTTSHYGKEGIDFGIGHPYLLLLLTDGSQYETPRYHMTRLAFDSRDRLVAPLQSPADSIEWLPCRVSRDASRVRLTGPRKAVSIDADFFAADELARMQDYVVVHGDTVKFRRGVYLDDIGLRLQNVSPAQFAEGCDGLD